MNFIELCTRANEIAKEAGWWDDERNDGELIALMHSEASEMYQALLTDADDEHLPQYTNLQVEAADVCIRIADFVGSRNMQLEQDRYIAEMSKNTGATKTITLILEIHSKLSEALEGLRTDGKETLLTGLGMAFSFAYTLTTEQVINAKMEYNVSRSDHKRENRAKEGGKKF